MPSRWVGPWLESDTVELARGIRHRSLEGFPTRPSYFLELASRVLREVWLRQQHLGVWPSGWPPDLAFWLRHLRNMIVMAFLMLQRDMTRLDVRTFLNFSVDTGQPAL